MSIQKPALDPLTSFPDSNEIVARIEKKRAIVAGNRELIRLREWDAVRAATAGRGVQRRVVKGDLTPVPSAKGDGCLLVKVNSLQESQSTL